MFLSDTNIYIFIPALIYTLMGKKGNIFIIIIFQKCGQKYHIYAICATLTRLTDTTFESLNDDYLRVIYDTLASENNDFQFTSGARIVWFT